MTLFSPMGESVSPLTKSLSTTVAVLIYQSEADWADLVLADFKEGVEQFSTDTERVRYCYRWIAMYRTNGYGNDN